MCLLCLFLLCAFDVHDVRHMYLVPLNLFIFIFVCMLVCECVCICVCVCIPFLWASRPKPPHSERIDWFIGGLSGSDWIYCPQTMFITQQRVMWAESAATREGGMEIKDVREAAKQIQSRGGLSGPLLTIAHKSPDPILRYVYLQRKWREERREQKGAVESSMIPFYAVLYFLLKHGIFWYLSVAAVFVWCVCVCVCVRVRLQECI